MIGYIKIFKPEMKYKEFLVYNAYYCGICKSLGERYGPVYRNLINYDAVFIAILLDSALENKVSLEKFRCVLHPTKRKYRCLRNDNINFAADLTVFLTGAKLRDNILDENDLLSKIGGGLLRKGFSKASKRLNAIAGHIEEELERLHCYEQENNGDIDLVSDCYGSIIRKILEYGCGKSDVSEELGWIGYQLGKWIYIADAWSDIEKDIKKNSFNPLLTRFGYDNGELKLFKEKIKDRTGFFLFASLDEISATFEQIDKKINSGIIRNILYEGLFNMTNNILNGVTEKNGTEKSV